jgi:CoA:oxalate CoA-transferase
VIKVEAPEVGDDSRNFGPFIEDYSAYFMSLNRGKESIALNLKNSDDKKIFDKILAKADILVENFKPGTLEKWGYGWKDVCEKYPKLIYASASGFGQTGPLKELPAYDMVVQGHGWINECNRSTKFRANKSWYIYWRYYSWIIYYNWN